MINILKFLILYLGFSQLSIAGWSFIALDLYFEGRSNMLVETDGSVHFLSRYKLIYNHNLSGDFLETVIDADKQASSGELVIDDNGFVHIIYNIDDKLTYYSNRSGEWTSQIINDDPGFRAYVSALIVDKHQNIHLTYVSGGLTQKDLFYTTNKTGWKVENIYSAKCNTICTKFFSTSLIADDNGVHMTLGEDKYIKLGNSRGLDNITLYNKIAYLSNANGRWQATKIKKSRKKSTVFSEPEIQIHNDTLHLVYIEKTEKLSTNNQTLKYATKKINQRKWVFTDIDSKSSNNQIGLLESKLLHKDIHGNISVLAKTREIGGSRLVQYKLTKNQWTMSNVWRPEDRPDNTPAINISQYFYADDGEKAYVLFYYGSYIRDRDFILGTFL